MFLNIVFDIIYTERNEGDFKIMGKIINAFGLIIASYGFIALIIQPHFTWMMLAGFALWEIGEKVNRWEK